jgi:hypothetical protein
VSLTTAYPYSLDRATERVYLSELASVLEIVRWRADELETCADEVRGEGRVRAVAVRYSKGAVSGATRFLGAIEAFLASYARASLILYPTAKTHEARGRHLRAALGIGTTFVNDRISDRSLRNGWMHLDEDIGDLAEQRDGKVTDTVIVPKQAKWYHFAQQGSIRMVDPEDLTIVLPKRGMWSLRPYFHLCRDLQASVRVALHNPYRWEIVDDIGGIAVGWGGKAGEWMIKALDRGVDIEVHAPSYREVVSEFARAVASWRSSHAKS